MPCYSIFALLMFRCIFELSPETFLIFKTILQKLLFQIDNAMLFIPLIFKVLREFNGLRRYLSPFTSKECAK